MLRRHRQLLGVALFPLGVFAVHQLRYQLAFGAGAPGELADQGHSYLQELTPWIVMAAALGLGGLIARLARAWRSGDTGRETGRCLLALWALASAGLLSIYVGQELLEGLYANGHAQGLAGVFGAGGLWALPASIAVGGLLALAVRGGHALVARVARRRRERPPVAAARAPELVVRPHSATLPRLTALAGAAAGRAPPVGAPLIA